MDKTLLSSCKAAYLKPNIAVSGLCYSMILCLSGGSTESLDDLDDLFGTEE